MIGGGPVARMSFGHLLLGLMRHSQWGDQWSRVWKRGGRCGRRDGGRFLFTAAETGGGG